MATIYYIDSENVGDGWIELLEEVADSDSKFLVFYTKNTPRIAYPQAIQLMEANIKPEFIKCYEGSNGLDFQLVSYLGYELCANNSNEMIIVSKDTGFDAVVNFWTERDMKVKRIKPSNSTGSKTKKAKAPVSDEGVITSTTSEEVREELFGVSREEIHTIINSIGAKDTANIHQALIHFYGNENGEKIYKTLKQEKFVTPTNQLKKEDKLKNLIDLVIRYTNTSNVKIPEQLPGFIANNVVDDKKVMAERMNKNFGKSGASLNKMFKPFYKMLAKIKKK